MSVNLAQLQSDLSDFQKAAAWAIQFTDTDSTFDTDSLTGTKSFPRAISEFETLISSKESEWDVFFSAAQSDFQAHLADTNNPHGVTAAQIGLGNVDNTADVDKPVSTATANLITFATATKADSLDVEIASGTGDVTIAPSSFSEKVTDITSLNSITLDAGGWSMVGGLDGPVGWFGAFKNSGSNVIQGGAGVTFRQGDSTGTSVGFPNNYEIVIFTYIGNDEWIVSPNGVLS